MFNCNLPPALLAEWPRSFTCYCGNMGVEWILKIRDSTECWPWRRKFSRCSCRDSNPQPFNHESGALTTELSLSQISTWAFVINTPHPPSCTQAHCQHATFCLVCGHTPTVIFISLWSWPWRKHQNILHATPNKKSETTMTASVLKQDANT